MTAAIKFTQGATTDSAGRALVVSTTGGSVTCSNGDDSGIVSWTWELVDVPPGSAIPLSTQGPGAAATFVLPQPDVPGCYRVKLTVVDSTGAAFRDIRNACVPFTNGYICPPYQGDPLPLPLTEAPDEMNIGGQLRGWAGGDAPAAKLLYQAIKKIDELAGGGSAAQSVIVGARAPSVIGWEIDGSDGCFRQSDAAAAGEINFPLSASSARTLNAVRVHYYRMVGDGTAPAVLPTLAVERRLITTGTGFPGAWIALASTTSYLPGPSTYARRSLAATLDTPHVFDPAYAYRLRMTGESGANAQAIKILDAIVEIA